MIPVHAFKGQRVGVLGLGRSGLAAARALAAGGAEPICWDDGEAARANAAGFQVADIGREREAAGLAALVVSPGIPHLYPAPHPAVARAQASGIPVDNDVGLFFRALADLELEDDPAPKVVAVTGSNGKSTTTALIHHVLKSAGRRTQMGGNIGRSVLDLDPPRAGEMVAVELSSYQTELARTLAPDVAVFLNLSSDHLDRHGGIGGYFAAKRRLFEIGAPEHAVVGVDEPEGRFLAERLAEGRADDRVTRISSGQRLAGEGWSVTARKGFLAEWRNGRQLASIDLRPIVGLPGAHNHQNACAAYAALRALGLAPRAIEAGFASFAGLPHRSQRVAEISGVVFVNDSKATNADSAAKALAAFERVRWIAGGLGKAGGIAALEPLFPRVVKAYLIGRSAPEFAQQLGATPHVVAGTMAEAVAQAAAEAEPGDTVLLAPAAASFDQFSDFEARGDAFTAAVRRLQSPAPQR